MPTSTQREPRIPGCFYRLRGSRTKYCLENMMRFEPFVDDQAACKESLHVEPLQVRQPGIDPTDLVALIDAAYEEARRRKETHNHETWGHMNNIQDFLGRCQNVISLVGRGSGRI